MTLPLRFTANFVQCYIQLRDWNGDVLALGAAFQYNSGMKGVDPMTMGEKILSLRKARGWSQEELADRVGVSRQAVSRWESDSAKPDADKIVGICDLFGVSADYLLRETYTEAGDRGEFKGGSSITGVQILGILLILSSVLAMIALGVLSEVFPHGCYTSFGHYEGFAGYILGNHLVWLVILIVVAFVGGILLLVGKEPVVKLFCNIKAVFAGMNSAWRFALFAVAFLAVAIAVISCLF